MAPRNYGLTSCFSSGLIPHRRSCCCSSSELLLGRINARLLGLAGAIGHVHAPQHVISEKEFAVGGHHHALQLVRKALGDNFANQQWILLQDLAFALHALSIGSGGNTNALRFRLGEEFAAFHFRFAVNDFGLGFGICVLHGRFFARLRLQLRLFDLFLFQRQQVFHGIGLALSLQHADLGLAFGLLHLLGFGAFGLQLGDPHLLLLDLGFNSHAVVFLFLKQQTFQSFGVFWRQLNVAQHNFLHNDPV